MDPAAVRAVLIEAARRCYRKLGVNRVRIQNIALAAQVGRATIYRHFNNRTAILLAVFRVELQAINDRFLLSRKPQRDDFCLLFLDYLVFVGSLTYQQGSKGRSLDDPEVLLIARALLDDEEALRSTAALFEESYRRARAEGEIHGDVDLPALIRFAARLMVSMTLLPERQEPSAADLEQFFNRHVIRSLKS